jgi:uncharacterized membrane protein YphA (DoxX/SURF4 family)
MLRDPRVHYTLAPLVLRLSLAAIFLFHGYHKVFDPNAGLGASWADSQWAPESKVPTGLLARVDQIPDSKLDAAARNQFKSELLRSYGRDVPPMPESLRWHGAQYAVAWGELLGGVALLVGLLTRVAALGLIVIQVGAIWTVTGMQGFRVAQGGGYEYNLALIAMCLALVVMGGGTCAVDRFFRRSTTKAPAAQEQSKVPVHA